MLKPEAIKDLQIGFRAMLKKQGLDDDEITEKINDGEFDTWLDNYVPQLDELDDNAMYDVRHKYVEYLMNQGYTKRQIEDKLDDDSIYGWYEDKYLT